MVSVRSISGWIVGHSMRLLLVAAAVSVFFAAQLPHLELDPSAEGLTVAGDPSRVYYERTKELFGSDSIIAVALHRPDTVFRSETLLKIKRIAAELERLDGVERVESLATSENFANSKEGVKPGPLYASVPTVRGELEELRRQALANHTFVGNLVSRDTRTAGFVVFINLRLVERAGLARALSRAIERGEPLGRRTLSDALLSPTLASALWNALPRELRRGFGARLSLRGASDASVEALGRVACRLLRERGRLRSAVLREAPRASRRRSAELVEKIQAVLDRHRDDPAEEIYQIGTLVMKVAASRYQRDDHARLLPYAVGVMAVVLAVAFRGAAGVVVPMLTVALAVLWTFGLMSLLGAPITVISVAIGPLLIAVGSSYSMHVVAHYYDELRRGVERRQAVERALRSCFLPVLLAGATTMVGFLSVVFSRLPSIRGFGLFSAFGILASLLLSLVVAPAALGRIPVLRPRQGPKARRLIDRFLRAIGTLVTHHSTAITWLGGAVAVGSVLGCLLVEVNTNYIGFFRRSDPVRVRAMRVHDELSGAVPISVVVDATRRLRGGVESDEWRGPFTDPALLGFLLELEDFLRDARVSDEADAPRGIDSVVSFADQVQLMYQSFSGERSRRLPRTREGVEALLDFFYKPGSARKYISSDFAVAHVYARTYLTSSRAIARIVRQLEDYARRTAPRGVTVRVTGETVLLVNATDEITRGQVRSLLIAFVVIFALMGILFTSLKAGVLSLVPNVVPVVGTFGLMGWLGIELNTATSLVASIALGIAVDDTIHYMGGFHEQMRLLGDQPRAMLATLFLRGKAMVFTSVALFCGFLVLTTSRFAPIVSFGQLTAIAMLTALFGDIVILPVLLRRVELVTLWELLSTKLPRYPSRWLSVLRGMKRSEARRVLLLSRLRRLRRGEPLWLPAPGGEDLSGPIWSDAGPAGRLHVVLKGALELRDGKTDRLLERFGPGEVLSQAAGPLRALAAQECELLTLDDSSLARLIRRYPRTAARLLTNLAFLLADRLYYLVEKAALGEWRTSPREPFSCLAGLDERQRQQITSVLETRTFQSGERVFRAGEPSAEMFVLLSGRVVLTSGEASGDVPLAEVRPGAAFGEVPDRAALPRVTSARCLDACEVVVVTEEGMEALAARRPRLAARWAAGLARSLASRLDATLALLPRVPRF